MRIPERPNWPYRLVRGLFRLFFTLLAKVDAEGLEQTPLEGPLLVAANHTSLFEGPLVLALLPRQPLTAMAKQEYQKTPIGWILKGVDPIYVARGEVDRAALREVLKRLKAGAAIGIAPEGTRSKTGQLIEGKEGAAYLALQSGATILPVAIWGQETLISDLKRFRRPHIYLRVGEPFKLDNNPSLPRREKVEAGTKQIMHALAVLMPYSYRGVYRDRV